MRADKPAGAAQQQHESAVLGWPPSSAPLAPVQTDGWRQTGRPLTPLPVAVPLTPTGASASSRRAMHGQLAPDPPAAAIAALVADSSVPQPATIAAQEQHLLPSSPPLPAQPPQPPAQLPPPPQQQQEWQIDTLQWLQQLLLPALIAKQQQALQQQPVQPVHQQQQQPAAAGPWTALVQQLAWASKGGTVFGAGDAPSEPLGPTAADSSSSEASEAAAAAVTVMAMAADPAFLPQPPQPLPGTEEPPSPASSSAHGGSQPFPSHSPAMSQPTGASLATAVPGGSEEGPLHFQPHATHSVRAALEAPVPRGLPVRGARDQAGVWQAWIHYNKKQAFFGRLGRQTAAVAADLVLTWQRNCLTAKVAEKAASRQFNVPGMGYDEDEELLAQLRQVSSADQMKQFLTAVVPQAPLPGWQHPAPRPTRQAGEPPRGRQRKKAAGGGGGGSVGQKRRRPKQGSGHSQAALAQAAGAGGAVEAVPAAVAGVVSLSQAHHTGRRKQAAPRRAMASELDPLAPGAAEVAGQAGPGGAAHSQEPPNKRQRTPDSLSSAQ